MKATKAGAHFTLFLFVAALFIIAQNENSPKGSQLMYG